MSYRGDVVLPSFCSVVEIKMPTAIVLSYTPEGLVIGADGRKMDSSDPSKGTDSAQKIFDIGNGTNHIACALGGVAEYTDEQTGEKILFDFNKEMISASRELIGKRCKNLCGYATRLSKIVSKRLNDAMEHEKISDLKGSPSLFMSGGTDIAMVFVMGFYNGSPQVAAVRLWHKNQILQDPEVGQMLIGVGARPLVGAQEIFRLVVETDDPRFAPYRRYRSGIPSITQQAEICASYIRACSDPEAVRIEPEVCAGIGGHVHIAAITLTAGFQWVPGFEPIPNA